MSKNIESRLRQTQPVILLGMHRSGTSLTTRLLIDVGIHMGRRLSQNAESLYFQNLNRRIFASANARWSDVDSILQMMGSQRFVEQQTIIMHSAIFQDRGIASFWGRHLWDAVSQGKSISWGWKDPRTSITFPIWMRLLPLARFVHVIRNGIDVAISINRRAQSQQRQWRRRFFPRDYSPAPLEFGYCFHLWEAYVSFILEHKHLIPFDQYLEIRYEDLLAEPYDQLRRLLDFLAYLVEDDVLLAACKRVDQSRLDNSRYAANYRDEIRALASSPLMQQLGYGYTVGS